MDIVSSSKSNSENFEAILSAHDCARRFRKYLKDRNLSEEEDMFNFLVMTEFLLKNKSGSLFKKVLTTFFGEDSDNLIALSNQKLFGVLALQASEGPYELNEDSLFHLEKARKDVTESLNPKYFKFLKEEPTSSSPIACLLSIL